MAPWVTKNEKKKWRNRIMELGSSLLSFSPRQEKRGNYKRGLNLYGNVGRVCGGIIERRPSSRQRSFTPSLLSILDRSAFTKTLVSYPFSWRALSLSPFCWCLFCESASCFGSNSSAVERGGETFRWSQFLEFGFVYYAKAAKRIS